MNNIEIISIPVTDQQRAKEFYLKLGFTLITEAPFEGDKKWIQLGLPGGGPSITLVTWFKNMPAGCINGLVINTKDIGKELEILKSNGITVGTIDDTPWGKFAAVEDPDGNRLVSMVSK
jgi:catechol 2,3-dioxygenase-like lactoylglutathione lyase family enzyme